MAKALINPVVEKLLKQESGSISQLTGFCAPGDGKSVRVYRDLQLDTYLDIPEEAVLHFSEPDEPLSPCHLFYRSSALVTYVVKSVEPGARLSLTGSFTAPMDDVIAVTRDIANEATSGCSCGGGSTDPAPVALAARVDGGPSLGTPCQMDCYSRSLQCPYSSDWCRIECYYCYEECKRSRVAYSGGTVFAASR